MTTTVKFTANTTWQEAATGPLVITLNPLLGFTEMVIDTTLPTDSSKSFYIKAVAGENYLDVQLETGDKMYLKAGNKDETVISWVQRTPA